MYERCRIVNAHNELRVGKGDLLTKIKIIILFV